MNHSSLVEEAQSKKDKKRGTWSGFFAFWLTVLAAIPVSLFCLSLLGDYWFLSEMLVNFRFQILAMLLPFPFLLALTRRATVTIGVSLVTIFCAVPIVESWIPVAQSLAGKDSIRLMSFNVLASNQNFHDVIAEIRRADPDLLIVAELNKTWETALNTLSDEYPWKVVQPRWHGYGIGFYSRLPISKQESIQLADKMTDDPAIDATVDAHGTSLRIIAVHFTSPGSPQRLQIRNLQLKDVAKWLDGNDTATVMAGDFNCTPFSNKFRDLCSATGLRDSRRGFGYLGSFPKSPFILRIPIDHAIVSPEIHVSGRELGNASGSDHLPLILDFSISRPGQE